VVDGDVLNVGVVVVGVVVVGIVLNDVVVLNVGVVDTVGGVAVVAITRDCCFRLKLKGSCGCCC